MWPAVSHGPCALRLHARDLNRHLVGPETLRQLCSQEACAVRETQEPEYPHRGIADPLAFGNEGRTEERG
jgi:hypothetical protein